MRRQQFQVGDRQVHCVPEPAQATTAGLKMPHRVEWPARTEVIVLCKPTRASSWLCLSAAVAQPWSNQWHSAEEGIVIESALKTNDQAETVIPTMNLTDEPHTLYRGTRISEAHVITKCDRVEGLLPRQPIMIMTAKTLKMKAGCQMEACNTAPPLPFRHSRVDIQIDPADLPEYLQPLMEGMADNLTLHQREELAIAIYQYGDVFSSGPTGMGRTGLVKHTIDIGDQRPIHLPPPHLPIAKQKMEREEVQKMLGGGGGEPGGTGD